MFRSIQVRSEPCFLTWRYIQAWYDNIKRYSPWALWGSPLYLSKTTTESLLVLNVIIVLSSHSSIYWITSLTFIFSFAGKLCKKLELLLKSTTTPYEKVSVASNSKVRSFMNWKRQYRSSRIEKKKAKEPFIIPLSRSCTRSEPF